jgi:tRNA threonylcarbamoyladenosine biosynthesis protein TsaE
MPQIYSDLKGAMTLNAFEQHAFELADESFTVLVAQAMAAAYQQQAPAARPSLVTLQGDLGAGKTTLVRAFLRALGWQGAVKSPTYTLIESYELPQGQVAHFDLYRLSDADELENLGARDYFSATTLCWVEWPERAAMMLPPADLALRLRSNGAHGRWLDMTSHSEAAQQWTNAVRQAMESAV